MSFLGDIVVGDLVAKLGDFEISSEEISACVAMS